MKIINCLFFILLLVVSLGCEPCDSEIAGPLILNDELKEFNFEGLGETIIFRDQPAEISFTVTEYTTSSRSFFVGDECPDGKKNLLIIKSSRHYLNNIYKSLLVIQT